MMGRRSGFRVEESVASRMARSSVMAASVAEQIRSLCCKLLHKHFSGNCRAHSLNQPRKKATMQVPGRRDPFDGRRSIASDECRHIVYEYAVPAHEVVMHTFDFEVENGS